MSEKLRPSPTAAPPSLQNQTVAATPAVHSPPTATQVDQLAASAASAIAGKGAGTTASAVSAPMIAVTPEINVGDLPLGKHVQMPVAVFNQDLSHEASVQVAVHGSSALRIISAPDRLRPSREGFDSSRVVQLEFRPTLQGRISGALEISMFWPNTGVSQTITVPIVGGAHNATGPTLDQQDAVKAEQERQASAAAANTKQQAEVDAAIKAEEKRDTHYHEGDKRRLDNARMMAGVALESLYKSRADGIDRARAEIGSFVRTQPKQDSSLLADLAWFALDVASAGIAGGIAKRLEPAIKQIMGTWHERSDTMASGEEVRLGAEFMPAGAGLVGLITDGIKHVVKSGGKKGAEELQGKSGSKQQDSPSGDDKEAFLHVHTESLIANNEERAATVTIRAHDALLPTLKRAPDQAVNAMDAITKSLQEERKDAGTEQTHQTVLAWIRYLSQTSLGSITSAAGKRHTDTSSANEKLGEHAPLHRHDGLIDVSFVGDARHPEQRVEITGAKLHGVTRHVAKHVTGKPLKDLGLAVRASGRLGGPSVSITVVRDEAGQVSYTDNTSVEWQQATWLARKAGERAKVDPGDQLRGARILIEDEIMAAPLEKNVETDSAE